MITKAHLHFSDQEEQYGLEQLQKMGIPKNMPFICFHARDSAYLDQLEPDRDQSYHD